MSVSVKLSGGTTVHFETSEKARVQLAEADRLVAGLAASCEAAAKRVCVSFEAGRARLAADRAALAEAVAQLENAERERRSAREKEWSVVAEKHAAFETIRDRLARTRGEFDTAKTDSDHFMRESAGPRWLSLAAFRNAVSNAQYARAGLAWWTEFAADRERPSTAEGTPAAGGTLTAAVIAAAAATKQWRELDAEFEELSDEADALVRDMAPFV